MAAVEQLVTDHLDLWASAIKRKSAAGRGSSSKVELFGIKKLRELILELAVRGLLVQQDQSDESASELLKKMAAEKARLVREGKIKKLNLLLPIADVAKPFELPDSWAWQHLADVFYPISVSKNKVKTSELFEQGKHPVVDQGQSFIAGYVDDDSLLNVLPGPVVVFGDHTSALKYIDFNFVAGADGVKILRPICCDERYFFLVCKTLPIESRGYGRHYSRLIDNLFPLPPLAEQLRIIAKVGELMALCDQLEQQTGVSLGTHQTLVETLLKALTSVPDRSQIASAWQRIAVHFDTLFTSEESIDQLKQTVLQLAVMGKLVPQDPDDVAASELLKRISVEKANLVKEGKIKKEKPASPIGEDEKPFELPIKWEWTRLSAISDIQGGIAKGKKYSQKDVIELPYLRVANVQRGFLVLDEIKNIEILESDREKYSVYPRDLLITEGGDWDKVGRTAIWPIHFGTMLHQNHVFKARLILPDQNEFWLEKYLNAPFARAYFAGSSKQTTNLASINKTQLSNTVLPLPPAAEQQRIVAKIDELMALCDQLKSLLSDAQTTQLDMADALTKKALAKT